MPPGMFVMLLLALLTCRLNYNEYYVKPDNDENVHHTLQYYVNNSDKYFTSHTQIQVNITSVLTCYYGMLLTFRSSA